MRNVLTIADKELRSYFASPIGYVLIGLFALLFGWFFYVYLGIFIRSSERDDAGRRRARTEHQPAHDRGVLQNSAVIILFVMPMITMRTYSEEKRSGTIELLLTSPVTDVQIILGKFFGAMGLYARCSAVTVLYIAILFWLGNPEWRPIAAGYLGPAADGRLFHFGRPADFEPDEEPDRRRRS